jgi:hypothetical protein
MHVFGEEAIVANRIPIQNKLEDRGTKCIFVGYAQEHSGDVFWFFKPKTKKIIMLHDVILLNNTTNVQHEIKIKTDSESDTLVQKNKRVENAMKKLNTFFNPMIKNAMAFVGAVDSGYAEPQTFHEAWNHQDSNEKNKWRTAIKKEFHDMLSKKVWRQVNKSNMPENCKPLGTKWVFKRKSSGIYRAQLVALGYNQIPGVDYSANFSPVVNEVTMRIVLMMMLGKNWKMELVDVETAFLYGMLDEEIYLRIPDGYNENVLDVNKEETCLCLQ